MTVSPTAKVCDATDVKVFVGYYFFFLECADRLVLADDGKPTAASLLALAKCGQDACALAPPPPSLVLPAKCLAAVKAACGGAADCGVCVRLHALQREVACNKFSRQNITDGYCGVPPPAFAIQHCYASVCPDSNGLTGDVGSGSTVSASSSPTPGDGRRRLFGQPTVECPQREVGVEGLEDWGYFWLTFTAVTVLVITIATAPAPYGVAGQLEQLRSGGGGRTIFEAPAAPEHQLAAATPSTSSGLVRRQPAAAAGGGAAGDVNRSELKAALLQAPAGTGSAGSLQARGPALAAADTSTPFRRQVLEVLHCWSFSRNYRALFRLDGGIRGMRVFNGMRVLAIGCVVLGHTNAFLSFSGLSNMAFVQIVMSRFVTVAASR